MAEQEDPNATFPSDYFSCDQAALRTLISVRPSVTFLTMFLSSYHPELSPLTDVMSMQKVEIRDQRSRSQRSRPNLAVSGEVPYCFSRSFVKFQGHTAKKSSTITPVWIQWWLWNDAQSLMQHRRGALLFFKAIRQISMSHGTKTADFYPN